MERWRAIWEVERDPPGSEMIGCKGEALKLIEEWS